MSRCSQEVLDGDQGAYVGAVCFPRSCLCFPRAALTHARPPFAYGSSYTLPLPLPASSQLSAHRLSSSWLIAHSNSTTAAWPFFAAHRNARGLLTSSLCAPAPKIIAYCTPPLSSFFELSCAPDLCASPPIRCRLQCYTNPPSSLRFLFYSLCLQRAVSPLHNQLGVPVLTSSILPPYLFSQHGLHLPDLHTPYRRTCMYSIP